MQMCRHNMQPSTFRPISPNEFGIKKLSIYIYIIFAVYIYIYIICLAPAKIGKTRISPTNMGMYLDPIISSGLKDMGKVRSPSWSCLGTPLQMLQKHGFLTQYLLELALVDSQMLRPAVPEGNIFS